MPIPTFESYICHSLTSRVHPACVRTCSYFLSDNLPDDEDLCTCWSYTCCSPAAANATNKVSIWCNCSSKTEICTAAYSSDYLRGLVAFLTEVLDEFYQAMNHQLHSQHHIFQLLPGWCYIIYANTKKWSLRNTVNCVFFSIRYYNLRLWTKAFASLRQRSDESRLLPTEIPLASNVFVWPCEASSDISTQTQIQQNLPYE